MKCKKQRRKVCVGALCLAMLGAVDSQAFAQEQLSLSGTVADPQGLPLPGVTVNVYTTPDRRLAGSTVTDGSGAFQVENLVPAQYSVTARLQGFQLHEQSVELSSATSPLEITLSIGHFEQQVVVTAQMPEVSLETIVPGQQLERTAAQDVAGYLRNEPGVGAVRRGSINLEPTVRGLYEAQMGVFVDGTRTFAAGPARMDSEISHVSPHMLQSVEVVKGPYALTQGSGTLSSLRAQTFRPAFSGNRFVLHGRGSFDFVGNGTAPDAFGGVWGATNRVRFTLFHNTRIGHDYTDGNGVTVPGDYQSYDTRWDFGVQPKPNLRLEYEGGYQDQQGLDYPGRILDATYFRTPSHSAEVTWRPSGSAITEVFGQVYTNRKHHRMNNDKKPTAQPDPNRFPPFGLRIDLPATSFTTGGSGYVSWRYGAWEGKVGADVYRLAQNATRSIYRRDTGMLLFEDIVWPDAKLTNGGGYGQVVYQRGRTRMGGTLRVDAFRARAGEVSDFFLEHTTGSLDYAQSAMSGALNATFVVQPRWTLTLGMGRAVRAPDTLERYSDRFPAAQFQVAAEFLGNPQLKAEKSLEFNAGSVLQFSRTTVRGDVFYRTIDHYITVMPDPTVPKRLPLSPPVVYRYINGKSANFTGFEASTNSQLGAYAAVRANWSYLWAEDTTFNEPAFGIAPFQQRYALEVHGADQNDWVEAGVTITAAQNRVAVARLEQPTDGWATLDVRGGFGLPRGLLLRAGVENLTNKAYAEHLNALNPFTGERILERGRSGYVGLEYAF
jgi:iron complex outermembrane receptor protein